MKNLEAPKDDLIEDFKRETSDLNSRFKKLKGLN